MLKYGEKLFGEMMEELDAIGFKEKVLMRRMEQSITVCLKYLRWIKDFVKANPPESQAQEIMLFKQIKPKFQSELLFHQAVLDIESRCLGDAIAFYEQEIDIQHWFLRCNASFYQYIKLESDHLDAKYFVRGIYDLKLGPDLSVMDADDSFSTSHDLKLSQVLCAEKIIQYLQKAIYFIRHPADSVIEDGSMDGYTWTDTKSALVELIYGIIYKGSVNHGKASMHGFVRHMERVFKIELGNFYDTYKTLRQRDQRTLYLDGVREELLRKMDEKLK
jgi:hypothetical protein